MCVMDFAKSALRHVNTVAVEAASRRLDFEQSRVIPLEAMDLVVDSRLQKLVVNPQHPNHPVALAK